MNAVRTNSAILDDEFLPIRAKLLEIAASLDRIDRAQGNSTESDPRLRQIRSGIETLLDGGPDRAEQIQLIFSLAYDDSWAETYRLASGR